MAGSRPMAASRLAGANAAISPPLPPLPPCDTQSAPAARARAAVPRAVATPHAPRPQSREAPSSHSPAPDPPPRPPSHWAHAQYQKAAPPEEAPRALQRQPLDDPGERSFLRTR
eukprot:CAMPEP_0205861968 /NCGR_PEP_ID=MMETSP1083-20121108/6057_1 /ASSEMBLY_ACC=CAM_ASM_000430 /TAXON_ID=97485 /ORGANISM="Prymnesium parvum, Strain Texoma1" /LENGTH=113 /DNA_ID=CAMNT_0053223717 /DNA_START=280 /DNA_END=619 /DNA_ORIENTATION=-